MILKEDYQSTTEIKNANILIVDNNISNILELKQLIQEFGKIEFNQNPIEAVNNLNNTKYDLIIVDVCMNEMTGFQFAHHIKQSHLNLMTPIMFVSAVSDAQTIINCYKYESASFMNRPFNPIIAKTQIYNILKTEALKHSIEKEKEQFIATLTHDLKSPINAEICALTQLLKKDKNEMLEELLNSAKYMKLITENILCYYKQKNKGISLKKEVVNFEELISSSINDLKYLANDKNIKINFHTNINKPCIELDVLEIKRVINNLLSNAIEYSFKDNCIDINLNTKNNAFIFEIRDYGIGINTENLNNIFDEYMSLAKQHKKTGFGLGLNICKNIIERHNGEISIDSTYGKVTSIQFKIPA